MYDYVTQDPALLNFKKGDVIQIVHNPEVEDGWLYGIFDKRSGYFPAEYVTHIKEVSSAQALYYWNFDGRMDSTE